MTVEVKIGVEHVQRELVVETDASSEELQGRLTEALAEGGVLTIVDTKGRSVVVPAGKVAYLEVGSSTRGGVGFR